MDRSRTLFLSIPLMVFAVTQALYQIYFPYLPTTVAYWRAPAEPAGSYYSPFLSNQPEIKRSELRVFLDLPRAKRNVLYAVGVGWIVADNQALVRKDQATARQTRR